MIGYRYFYSKEHAKIFIRVVFTTALLFLFRYTEVNQTGPDSGHTR